MTFPLRGLVGLFTAIRYAKFDFTELKGKEVEHEKWVLDGCSWLFSAGFEVLRGSAFSTSLGGARFLSTLIVLDLVLTHKYRKGSV